MSGLRFRVGEMARFVVPASTESLCFVGEVVEIVAVGPFAPGDIFGGIGFAEPVDYIVLFSDKESTVCDWQLRKLDPPAEPASLTRNEECEAPA